MPNKRKAESIWGIIFLLLTVTPAVAQKNKIHFSSYNAGGVIIGASQTTGMFQTVNGVEGKNWFSGIGIGVDYYRYRTVPVFIDGKYFFEKENKFFVYGDIGLDIPWKPGLSKSLVYYDIVKYHTGVYTDGGIGFKTPLSKQLGFTFSLGYSYKNFKAKIGTPYCEGDICSVNYSNLSFAFSRVILKMGIHF